MNRNIVWVCLLLLFSVSSLNAQSCAGNLVRDASFEGASYYCRNSADEIANDNINLCTIGYNGTDLSAVLNVPNQVNLNTALFPGIWIPTGPVDVITPNYQPTSGLWALKLNGQFGAGGVTQNVSIPLPNSQCTLQVSDATNLHAPIGYSASYQVVLQRIGDAAPAFNATRLAPPVPNPASATTLTRENMTMTLGGAGTYLLSFISNDRTPVSFSDGLYTTQTYFGRTGAVIDAVCLTCLASPSPSVTASVTPTSTTTPTSSRTASPSLSSTSSISRSASSSISLSGTVSPSLTSSVTPTTSRSLSSSNSISLTSSSSISFSGTVSPSLTSSVTPTTSRSLSSSNSISLTSSSSISISATSSISISATPTVTVSPSLTSTPSTSFSSTASISISSTPSASFSASASPSASPPPPPTCPGPYATDDDDAWRNFYHSRNDRPRGSDQTVVNLYFADILNHNSDDDDQGWENVPTASCNSCSQNY